MRLDTPEYGMLASFFLYECALLLGKGFEHFFQCFTLLRGKPSQEFQKLLLLLRSEPVLWLRMILAVHKRYLLLSANPVQLSVQHESDVCTYNRYSEQDR